MFSFDYLLTKEPHNIRAVFVSDLHLQENSPFIVAFLALLQDLMVLPNLHTLYILGDFLDAWVGDELFFATPNHWLHPIITALAKLPCAVVVMHGNRDFMLGVPLCRCFGGKLIAEPAYLYHHGKSYRLEHGDKLCTDDIAYQRYRRLIRHPITQFILTHSPITIKQRLKTAITTQSTRNKTTTTTALMDTNAQAVHQAMQYCDYLIHGHTHKAGVHYYGDKTRFVLGDWQFNLSKRDKQVTAVIGVLGDEFELSQFCFSVQIT